MIHTRNASTLQKPLLYRGLRTLMACLALLLLTGCESNMVIVNDVGEREANEIIVFLASKGIPAAKTPSGTSAPGGTDTSVKWSIAVPPDQSTEAMAILNQNGLPRQKGISLLDLFAKSGLMQSEQENAIRYQAGLAEQIAGVIRKIDGLLYQIIKSIVFIISMFFIFYCRQKAKLRI